MIDPKTREGLDAIAAAATHKWQTGHIRKGLREAQAGKFAKPAEVRRIINRLRGR